MSDLMSLALVLLDVTLGPLISKHMGLGLAWPACFFWSLALVLLDVTLGLLISKHMGLGLDWPAWFFGLLKI